MTNSMMLRFMRIIDSKVDNRFDCFSADIYGDEF